MAQITVLNRPGDVAVVAGAAILAIDDLQHIYLVSAGPEFETQIRVADLAAEPDAMKPVREHDRPHTGLVRIIVHYYVTEFGGHWTKC